MKAREIRLEFVAQDAHNYPGEGRCEREETHSQALGRVIPDAFQDQCLATGGPVVALKHKGLKHFESESKLAMIVIGHEIVFWFHD